MSEEPLLQNVKSYSIIRGRIKSGSGHFDIDLFVRRYKSDGKLHYFDWRSSDSSPYISDRDAAGSIDVDLGIIELPAGKTSRNQLGPFDVLKVYGWNGKDRVQEVTFVENV